MCSSIEEHLGWFYFLTTVKSVATNIWVQVSLDFFYKRWEYTSVYLTHYYLDFSHFQMIILSADTNSLAITMKKKNLLPPYSSCLEVETIKKQKDLCDFFPTTISCVSLGLSSFIYKMGINSAWKERSKPDNLLRALVFESSKYVLKGLEVTGNSMKPIEMSYHFLWNVVTNSFPSLALELDLLPSSPCLGTPIKLHLSQSILNLLCTYLFSW